MLPPSGELDRDFTSELTGEEIQAAEEFRKEQQVAVLVVMFTDVEGSTQLLESKGEREYAKLRQQHDELVRTVVEREAAGRCIKHLGDGYMALFTEPSTAVERSLEIQERLDREAGLKVRIGLDMGQVAVEKVGGVTRDAFGRFVNRAARITSAAQGGQTLGSYHVWDSAVGWLRPGTVATRKIRNLRVKGFIHPVPVYEFHPVRQPEGVASIPGLSRPEAPPAVDDKPWLGDPPLAFQPEIQEPAPSQREEEAQWEKRRRLQEGLRDARNLWGEQRFGEFVAVLTELQKELSGA